jgi:hypothetical protein
MTPFFRITEMHGDRDGLRWGYGVSSTHRRHRGHCLWSYDILTDTARLFVKFNNGDISAEELDDPALTELARNAIRVRLAEAQGRTAA